MLMYLMLYIMLAFLMLFAALFNVVCLCNAFFGHGLFQMFIVFIPCLGFLTHSLFVSNIILHRAQCF